MGFAYIKQIIVNDCYSYQNFKVPNTPLSEFKHIVLTGRNGSGKTTVLNRISEQIQLLRNGNSRDTWIQHLNNLVRANPNHSSIESWKEQLVKTHAIELIFFDYDTRIFKEKTREYIFSHFAAHRMVNLETVKTVTTENEFYEKLKDVQSNSTDFFTRSFKQYLVNKKVYEAFDYMDSNKESVNQNKIFFEKLTDVLRSIFHDRNLSLVFVRESFEFYIQYTDGRRVNFNHLSEGFSAFLSIVMDLLMRTDLIRKIQNDFSFNPPGIILIDEPETHFHLSMQYEILPLITTLFPNIQLIIATHSPAIISSLKNAVVYDISSQKEVSDWLLGSSYSELMIKHFGLENEFSPIADKIIYEVSQAVLTKNKAALQTILAENEKYITPSLRLEIESQIIKIESL